VGQLSVSLNRRVRRSSIYAAKGGDEISGALGNELGRAFRLKQIVMDSALVIPKKQAD